MKAIVWFFLGSLVLFGVLVWLNSRIRYRISRRHLEIRWWGICLRRIELSAIHRVSKRPIARAENWANTIRPSHRVLVIHRRSGWFKNLIVTPKNRYIFRAELQRAIDRVQSPASEPSPQLNPDPTQQPKP